MAKISTDAEINSVLIKEQGSAPATPASGYGRIYCKSDGVYFIGDDGIEIGPLGVAGEGGGYTEGARVYNNADVSLTQNTDSLITFNTEDYDTDTIHDTGSNTGRLTCKTAGKYLIIGNARLTTGNAQASLMIKFNGGNYIATVTDPGLSGGPTNKLIVSTIYDLAENEYVELWAYCEAGTPNAIFVADYSPTFMMQRIG